MTHTVSPPRGRPEIDAFSDILTDSLNFLPAEELARAGLAAGSDEALAAATALFAGPSPWLAEIF